MSRAARADDHAYLGACDLASVAWQHHAPGATALHLLLPCDTLVLPGERAALAIPTALLRRAATLCLVARSGGAPSAPTGTLVQVTSARAEDRHRAVQLCACIGVCRVRVVGAARASGEVRTVVLDALGAEEGGGGLQRAPREALAGASHVPSRLWRSVDAQRLAEGVRLQWQRAGLRALPLPDPCPPPVLAWCVLRSLPMDEGTRRELFASASVCCVLRREAEMLRALAAPGGGGGGGGGGSQGAPPLRTAELSCRACAGVVARESVAALASPAAVAGGVEAGGGEGGSHVFVNPAGASFRIFTVPRVVRVLVVGEATVEHTWFPGFAWQSALCGSCGNHLGWRYSSAALSFFGLSAEEVRVQMVAAEQAVRVCNNDGRGAIPFWAPPS
jgi:hypothetical protein